MGSTWSSKVWLRSWVEARACDPIPVRWLLHSCCVILRVTQPDVDALANGVRELTPQYPRSLATTLGPVVLLGLLSCGSRADVNQSPGPDAPNGCDLSREPKDSPACVDESFGVFVAPTGDDNAEGTRASPLRTLTSALAKAGSRRIYLCEGLYEENVVIDGGAEIYGGFSCGRFAYTGVRPRVAPPKGVAFTVSLAQAPLRIVDLEIVGTAEQGNAGADAIAVFVAVSADVTFRRCLLRAGNGNKGATGDSSPSWSAPLPVGLSASGETPGGEASIKCSASRFSQGGAGGAPQGAGPRAGTASPPVGADNAGSTAGTICVAGSIGANGLAARPARGSFASGRLSMQGWRYAEAAQDGDPGGPGQGGGGGGASQTLAGGGGGVGGCGGSGGRHGGSGGASFALLIYQAHVAIDGGELSSSDGGDGGPGGTGMPGQQGGLPGGGACAGGPGGAGAGGSGGGGGAGGYSMALAFRGLAPTISSNTRLTAGAPGAGGAGGTAGLGPGNPGNDGERGEPGVRADVPTFP